jgi:hypothetical protein
MMIYINIVFAIIGLIITIVIGWIIFCLGYSKGQQDEIDRFIGH